MHQQTAQLLGFERNLTVKGDGGEAEAKPDGESILQWVVEGELEENEWPRIVPRRFVKEGELDPAMLGQVWRGEAEHEYGVLAIKSTIAMLLKLLGEAGDQQVLLTRAEKMWDSRTINQFSVG